MLRDLTDSGVVYSTGRGNAAIYGLSSDRDRERVLLEIEGEKLKAATWYAIYRRAQTYAELGETLGAPDEQTRPVVEQLLEEGLVSASSEVLGMDTRLESRRFSVPVGAGHGWEVAVFDHYRAVLDAIATKLRLRGQDTEAARYVGGATLVFDVYVAHPMRQVVLGLLDRVRREVNEVYDRVSQYNREHPFDEKELRPVTFYFGQNAESPCERADHEE